MFTFGGSIDNMQSLRAAAMAGFLHLEQCVMHCVAPDGHVAACRSRGAIGLAGREALKQPTWCRLQPDGFASLAGRVPRDRPENLLFLAKPAAGGPGRGAGAGGRHRQHSSAAAAAGVAGGAGPQPAVTDAAGGPSQQVSSRDQSPSIAGGR